MATAEAPLYDNSPERGYLSEAQIREYVLSSTELNARLHELEIDEFLPDRFASRVFLRLLLRCGILPSDYQVGSDEPIVHTIESDQANQSSAAEVGTNDSEIGIMVNLDYFESLTQNGEFQVKDTLDATIEEIILERKFKLSPSYFRTPR